MRNGDSTRTLRLVVLLLQKTSKMNIAEVAEHMGIDRRTLYRDIELLKRAGFQILTNNHNVRLEQHTSVTNRINAYIELDAREKQSITQASMRQALLEAIDGRMRVVLEGYSSPSSNSTRDRLVEPFALSEDQDFVWAFEVESESNKVFRISRIQNVKMLKDEPWLQSRMHKAGFTDAFHMINFDGKKTHVKMRMKRRAYNLLIEEYPSTISHITHDAKLDEWIYDDYVSNLVGIGRFVVGLSDCITVETPELRSYVLYFAQKYILQIPYPDKLT